MRSLTGYALSVFMATAMLILLTCGVAEAHARLVRCSIANGQVFHAGRLPHIVRGTFAEDLDPAKSWMGIFEGGGEHGLVTERERSVVNYRDPREMTLAIPRTLTKGKYYVMWYTRSAVDNHIAAGVVYFRVG